MAALWRRRRKTWLVGIALVLLGGVAAFQLLRNRVELYSPGEVSDGLVDTLARNVPEDHPRVRFTEVAQEAGLRFRHFPATRSGRLPEDMGSGVALGDVNGDGWTDAFLVNVAGPLPGASGGASGGVSGATPPGRSRLFLNRGAGRFEDATEASGIEHSGLGNGAAFVDVDSDADLDLFVASYGFCSLFLNDGRARFLDGSEAAGLNEHEGFWAGVSVADYDRDGWMDVYVTGYVVYQEGDGSSGVERSPYGRVIPARLNPSNFEAERNLLLRGNGDGTFAEVSEEAGVANETGRSLGALFCDLDGDDWPDIYVANDLSDNAYFVNVGDGTFIDLTAQALVGDYRGAMGLAASDFDRDLDLDLFITHWVAQENALYSQYPAAPAADGGAARSFFIDESSRYGLGHSALDKVGWATRFFDYDNDGSLDLFVVNGSTIPLEDQPERLEPMRSQLFWNDPDEQGFFEVGAVSGDFFRDPHVGRGGAVFDYDLDGDEDLVVVSHGEPAALLRNDGGNDRPCVRVRLRQPAGNRFAVGAKVYGTAGGRTAFEVLESQGSYLSQHAVGELSFGLGDAAALDELAVIWPDGVREEAGPFLAHSLVTWVRGSRPVVQSLPGRRELDAAGPRDVEGQRAFYAVRKEAQQARVAGDFARAVELYRRALALWPGHADCLYYLGNSLLELGDEAAALRAFERMVAFEELSSQGWMQIGWIRLPGGDPELDDLEAAGEAFERCHAINGEESRPVIQLGVVAMLRGEHAEAERLFRDAARLNPKSVEARWFAGRMAWLRGDSAAARELLESARQLAGASDAGASVSNEGDTESGRAMTATAGIRVEPLLARWTTLGQRPADVEREYGDSP